MSELTIRILNRGSEASRAYAFRLVLTNFIGKFLRGYTELVTFDLPSSKVSFVRTVDPAAGPIFGAVPVQH